MTRSRSFRVLVFVAMVALFACSQLAIAQEKPHLQIKVVPKMNSDAPAVNPGPPANLYGLGQQLTATPYPAPLNSDKSETVAVPPRLNHSQHRLPHDR